MRKPVVDYREFRISKLNSREFYHVKYLIFWPIFGLLFLTLERLWIRPYYHPVHCSLDDKIPFCEYFLIPYLLWFIFLIFIQIYTFFYEPEAFVRFMQTIIITYMAAVIIYILFPNCQELRPQSFERENIFTGFIRWFYTFDTNTNVCPSLHVIGSVAVMFAAWDTKKFGVGLWPLVFGGLAFLISISTVFLKQHSIIDLFAAIPICVGAYFVVYHKKWKKVDK